MRRLGFLGILSSVAVLGAFAAPSYAQTCAYTFCSQPANCGKSTTCEVGGGGGSQTVTCAACPTATTMASPTRTATTPGNTGAPPPTATPPPPPSGYPSCQGLCTASNCERSFRCDAGGGVGLQDITCGACT